MELLLKNSKYDGNEEKELEEKIEEEKMKRRR